MNKLLIILLTVLTLLCVISCTRVDDAVGDPSKETDISAVTDKSDESVTLQENTEAGDAVVTDNVLDPDGFEEDETIGNTGTATAKVLTGIYNSYVVYPEGAEITIYLPALSAKIENYQLTIGLADDRDKSQLTEMDSQVILDRHITRHATKKDTTAQLCTINELSTLLCGELVTISDLYFIDSYEDEQNPTGKLCTLSNTAGDVTYLYIDKYSVGYNKTMPKEAVDITAIVTYGYIPQSGQYDTILLPRCSSEIGL